MKITLKPWQVMPANIIRLALDHSKRKNDFDDQVAFLLLDVGVETTFKTFLSLRGKLEDNKDVGFKDLINSVKNELKGDDHEIDLNEADYFHKIRNKLYHRGDGTKPTSENLQKYSGFAQELLKVLLDVDLPKIESETKPKYSILNEDQHYTYTIEDAASELSTRLRYFHESCALVVEQLHPNFTKLKLALELKKIWEDTDGSSLDSATYGTGEATLDTVHYTEERSRQFLGVTKKHMEHQELEDFGLDVELDCYSKSNRDFVDSVIENPTHLYVWLVLQDFSKNSDEEWSKYQHIARTISLLPGQWILSLDESRLDIEKVTQEYKEMNSWIVPRQNELDKWVKQYMPDFQRPEIDLLSIPIVWNLD